MPDFIVLFLTHILCLCLGWYFGIRVHNPHLIHPQTEPTKTDDVEIDIYDTERLDYS